MPCFCFGLTNDCKCANYYKDMVSILVSRSDLPSSAKAFLPNDVYIAQFRYFNIQPKTIDITTRPWGNKPHKLDILGRILIYRNWTIRE